MKKIIVIGIIGIFLITNIAALSTAGKIAVVKTWKNNLLVETDLMTDESSAVTIQAGGLMDSPWPMHSHDIRHTGRSPYSTVDNVGIEKWRYRTDGPIECSSVAIGKDGTIFFGSDDKYLHALYPNGTLKWEYKTGGWIESSPAIDENGTIYVGTAYGSTRMYAINPNGTMKWSVGTGEIYSSPAIGDDGTIYFGEGYNICALYPDGSLKWKYETSHYVFSSPAIGDDGTIYCGSHDCNVYALYPNNGTVKWIFETGGWVHGYPAIGDDGIVYINSNDDYLYALYPNNGTEKWRCGVGGMRGSPAIDKEGTLYLGVWQKTFFAIYPNGTIKWSFKLGENSVIWGSSAAISDDGVVYFGASVNGGGCLRGGDIIALSTDDGALLWRDRLCGNGGFVESSPVIGEDGTVYIGSFTPEEVGPNNWTDAGYLHALRELDPNAPDAPSISGYTRVIPGVEYEYTFVTTDPNGDDVYYYIAWGDIRTPGEWEIGPYNSGEEVKIKHTWYSNSDTYHIRARAMDVNGLRGLWATLDITLPVCQRDLLSSMLFQRFLGRFSDAFQTIGELEVPQKSTDHPLGCYQHK